MRYSTRTIGCENYITSDSAHLYTILSSSVSPQNQWPTWQSKRTNAHYHVTDGKIANVKTKFCIMNADQLFEECIKEGKLALEEKEVAIGCVFHHVESNKIIARSRNSVNATKNATRHAELNCIDDTINYCQRNDLKPDDLWPNIDVYVTCEPCIMCARILRHLKVRKVVYGCSNDRFGGCRSVLDVASLEDIPEPKLQYTHGVREKDTIELLKTFYSFENLNAPEEIRKVKRIRTEVDPR